MHAEPIDNATQGLPDPWSHILTTLPGNRLNLRPDLSKASCEGLGSSRPAQPRLVATGYGQSFHPNVIISVLNLDERYATIAWQDATSCRYGDQRWYRCPAPFDGVCSLTGFKILRGSDVFRPSRRGLYMLPANADAMILAAALQRQRTLDLL
uniref:DUF3331 domain-containing protein n=1 Tax=Caballeronia sp. LjRoot34 TaxID=3342325 RepID=UPI003F4F778B